MRIVAAQLKFSVGNCQANAKAIIEAIQQAREALKADVIVFPELAVSGYLAEDYFLSSEFKRSVCQAMQRIIAQVVDITVILGFPEESEAGLFNAACVIQDQKIQTIYRKQCLPNSGVFDECRYFIPGHETCVVTIGNIRFGLLICEDVWQPEPIEAAQAAGAQYVIVLNASPFFSRQKREVILAQRVTTLPIIYVNTVGGQADLVFDGGSLFMDSHKRIHKQAPFMKEALMELDLRELAAFSPIAPRPSEIALLWQALVLAIQDYAKQHHFTQAIVGASGGIDSSVVLALAVDALGVKNVHAVLLPSRYTSELSTHLALALCQTLGGVSHRTISIEPNFQVCLSGLGFDPVSPAEEKTVENLQARCRGILLMGIANQTGVLLLNTTNKSELAVGYGTLYGDLIGGFAPLKDVFKTKVYQLAEYRNQINSLFSASLLNRPPTAELRWNQRDEESLPPYEILDLILESYIEQNKSVDTIVQAYSLDPSLVRQVITWVSQSEFKRRQAPIGPCLSGWDFGRGRRYPLVVS